MLAVGVLSGKSSSVSAVCSAVRRGPGGLSDWATAVLPRPSHGTDAEGRETGRVSGEKEAA
jgi:hypothetical protein